MFDARINEYMQTHPYHLIAVELSESSLLRLSVLVQEFVTDPKAAKMQGHKVRFKPAGI